MDIMSKGTKGKLALPKTKVLLGIAIVAVLVISSSLYFILPILAPQEKTLVFMHSAASPREQGAVQDIIDSFMEQNPGVTVTQEPVAEDIVREKMDIAIAAGTVADILYIGGGDVVGMAKQGVLLPLDDVRAELTGQSDAFYKFGEYDGKTYGIPHNLVGNMFLYNIDHFEEAGIPLPPMSGWTWNEFTDAADKLTVDKDGDGMIDVHGWLNPTAKDWPSFSWGHALTVALGGSYYKLVGDEFVPNLDSPEFKKMLELTADLQQYSPPSAGVTGDEFHRLFAMGKVSMAPDSGRALMAIEENNPGLIGRIGTTSMPVPPGRPTNVVYGTVAWMDYLNVSTDSKNPELAKKFVLHFMTGDDYIRWVTLMPTLVFPSRDYVFDEPAWNEATSVKNWPGALEGYWLNLKNGFHPAFELGIGPNVNSMEMNYSGHVQDAMQEVILKGEPIDKVAKKYQKMVEEEIGNFPYE